MTVPLDALLDLPVRKFCKLLKNDSVYSEYVYLLNTPIRGLTTEKSKNKILIGGRGHLSYLNSVSYNLGYVFELPSAHTLMHSTHILIGSINSEMDAIGDISTLFIDNNITILQNKKHSSYLIVPVNNQDIPQPIF
jgi:hypothetical protein